MSARIALAAGLVAVLIALGLVLAESKPRQAGSNYVPEYAEAVKLRDGAGHCQVQQTIPKDTAGVRLLLGTYGRQVPRLAVTVEASGSRLTSGSRAAGGGEGHVIVPLRPVRRSVSGATVCVRPMTSARTVLYGTLGQVRFEWLRRGSESWYALAPTVAHRFALAKVNPFGWLLLPLVALLLLIAWLLAARLVVREVGR